MASKQTGGYKKEAKIFHKRKICRKVNKIYRKLQMYISLYKLLIVYNSVHKAHLLAFGYNRYNKIQFLLTKESRYRTIKVSKRKPPLAMLRVAKLRDKLKTLFLG